MLLIFKSYANLHNETANNENEYSFAKMIFHKRYWNVINKNEILFSGNEGQKVYYDLCLTFAFFLRLLLYM